MDSKLSQVIWSNVRDCFMIVVGLTIYAFGLTAFILPEHVTTGGVTGVAALIYFKWGIPVAISNYSINLLLLLMAFRVVGVQFVWRTIFGATSLSLILLVMQPLFHEPFVQQAEFMNIIIGSLMLGFGIGLAFVNNGSTGGTDIIAAMVSKHTNVTIGRMMMYCDLVIVSSSYLVFGRIDNVVYGFVVLLIASFTADYVINTNRQAVQFTIISKRWGDIANAINNHANRGCTVFSGMGWYSKAEVKMLLVMCRKIESVNIFRIVKAIDNDAFITQSNVNGVYGQGFDEMKVKLGKLKTEDLLQESEVKAKETEEANASQINK